MSLGNQPFGPLRNLPLAREGVFRYQALNNRGRDFDALLGPKPLVINQANTFFEPARIDERGQVRRIPHGALGKRVPTPDHIIFDVDDIRIRGFCGGRNQRAPHIGGLPAWLARPIRKVPPCMRGWGILANPMQCLTCAAFTRKRGQCAHCGFVTSFCRELYYFARVFHLALKFETTPSDALIMKKRNIILDAAFALTLKAFDAGRSEEERLEITKHALALLEFIARD
jgi:hypothetical protein